jgi:hypothetical protein
MFASLSHRKAALAEVACSCPIIRGVPMEQVGRDETDASRKKVVREREVIICLHDPIQAASPVTKSTNRPLLFN